MQKVFLVHGYTASPDSHWFPWLEKQCQVFPSVEFHRLTLPDPDHPQLESWLGAIEHQIDLCDHSILIGHSLGCISLLRFLAKQDMAIKGLLLVAGFAQSLTQFPELDPFVKEPLPYSKLQAQIKNRVMIYSDDDPVVPSSHSEQLTKALLMESIEIPDMGHFIERHGVTEFPMVFEVLKRILLQA